MNYFFFLKNFSAGHPISLCLQYLQAYEPLTNAFPPEVKKTRINNNVKINQEKLVIKIKIAPTIGKIENKRSGNKSFIFISLLLNNLGLPFLKIRAEHLPLPKAQNLS